MAGSTKAKASEYLEELAAIAGKMNADDVDAYGDLLFEAWHRDAQVFFFGNGGSMATASHFVCDAVKLACEHGEHRLRGYCLADNTPMMTALGNDYSYDEIFSHPLSSYARDGDVAVAVSCSGNSPNVVNALEVAHRRGLKTVAMTGCSGGRIADMVDLQIHVPTDNYGVIEDLHLSIGHMAAQRLRSLIDRESKQEGAA